MLMTMYLSIAGYGNTIASTWRDLQCPRIALTMEGLERERKFSEKERCVSRGIDASGDHFAH
jgi:hypothetical protein